MNKFIGINILLTLAFAIAPADSFAHKRKKARRCTTPGTFLTVCDLRNYANSPLGTPAHSLYQGYVIGRMQPVNEFCQYSKSSAELVALVKNALLTSPDCAGPAAGFVDSRLNQFRACL